MTSLARNRFVSPPRLKRRTRKRAERQEPEDQGAAESLPASSAQYLPSLPDPASMGLGVGTLETFDDIEGDPLWGIGVLVPDEDVLFVKQEEEPDDDGDAAADVVVMRPELLAPRSPPALALPSSPIVELSPYVPTSPVLEPGDSPEVPICIVDDDTPNGVLAGGSNDASPPLKLRKVAVKAGGRGRVKRAQQQRSKRSLYKDMDRVATEQGRSQRRLKSASSSSSRSKLSNVFRATRASGLEYAKPLTEAQRRKREANALRKHEQQVALTAALEARSDSVYELARRELHKARVVGREEELAHLLRFVGGCLERKQGGSVYVYGPSGVGKSATVAHTAAELETRHQFKRVTLNLAAESVVDLCRETLERVALLGKAFVATLSEEQVKAALRDTLRERATLMVIEEADHGPHLDSLRTLWAMANDERLRLILVATGNTLNFASDALRHLPMRELHFAPYTGAQIAEIIRQRLTPAVVERIFDPRALQLLGDRVSKESGDLRAAVAMVGRALDAAEDEHNTRVDDGPMVGRVTVSVMSRASETQASSAGRINAIASLAPVSRQLLGALVKERQLHRGGESVFGEHDIRRVFREAMRVDRLDHKELRLALEALQDAMLLDWDDTRRSCTLKVDLRIAQQALTDDQGLQALQID